jgi:hypothetical protein
MHDHNDTKSDTCGPQARDAINRLIDVVLEGLRHGHFRCAITSAIGKNNKRDLVIEADAEYANDDTIQCYRWESEAGDQRHGGARSHP